MHDYADDVKTGLINFLVNLVKIIIGEEKDVTLLSSEHSDTLSSESSDQSFTGLIPFVICIDDAHRMCPTSWRLLDEIVDNCDRIAIFLLIKSDQRDRMKINKNSIESFESFWNNNRQETTYLRIVDLPTLKPEQIGQLIVASAE